MKRATITAGAFATILVLLALAAQDVAPDAATSPAMISSTAQAHDGLLYGRVTTHDGAVYEGRLRWGGNEEALWGNYFNGFKDENSWVAYAPAAEGAPVHLRDRNPRLEPPDRPRSAVHGTLRPHRAH